MSGFKISEGINPEVPYAKNVVWCSMRSSTEGDSQKALEAVGWQLQNTPSIWGTKSFIPKVGS